MTIKRGQTVTFQVNEDPETGYEWIIDVESTKGLFKVYDKYVPPKENNGQKYAGLKQFIIRIGDKVGKGSFRIALSRPW